MSDEFDFEGEEGFDDEEAPQKKTLQEILEDNPILKVVAVVIVVGAVFFAYNTFFGASDQEQDVPSRVSTGAKIKGQVGEEADPVYTKAIEQSNVDRAKLAQKLGKSAIPTPIGTPTGRLEAPESGDKLPSDPLSEWRRAAEARRMILEEAPDENTSQPEVVPMVEPIRPQPTVTADPELTSRLSEQMRVIVTSKKPKKTRIKKITAIKSPYSEMIKAQKQAGGRSGSGGGGGDGDGEFLIDEETGEVVLGPDGRPVTINTSSCDIPPYCGAIISAGEVEYSQFLTEVNSDIPGPVMAHVLSGPMTGARVLGGFEVAEDYLVLTFDTLVAPDMDGLTFDIDAVAMDPDTTLVGMATDVDNHYISRVLLPAAAEFIVGFTESIAETNQTTVTTTVGGAVSSEEELDTQEELASGYKLAAQKVGEFIEEAAPDGPTIVVARGTTFGLLFLDTLDNSDANIEGN